MTKSNEPPASVSSVPIEYDGSDCAAAYLEYNRILRTWFVAFGVGGPALFLVNAQLAKELVAAGQLRQVVSLFLFGAMVQVAIALLNKAANWYVYLGTVDSLAKDSRRGKFADWVLKQFWIDLVIDVATTISFGSAAWLLMTVFVKHAS